MSHLHRNRAADLARQLEQEAAPAKPAAQPKAKKKAKRARR